MTIAWPSGHLPRPLANGYGLQSMPATARTDMDNSVPRMRRRFTRTLTTAALSFNMRAWQLAIFDGFVRGTLSDGTAWFTITLRNGGGDQTWTVRGIAPPDATMIDAETWHVVWKVEVDQIPQLSAGDVAGIILLPPGASLASVAGGLHQFTCIDYPADSIAPLGP